MPVRALLCLGVIALGVAWAIPAAAQIATKTITFPVGSFRRDLPFRPETQGPNWISRADCVADDKIYLTVNFSEPTFGGLIFEVWAGIGIDCTVYEQRQGASPRCWQVFQGTPSGLSMQIPMRAQDIVARNISTEAPSGPNSGTEADCDEGSWPSDATDVAFYFMMVGAGGDIPVDWGTAVWEDTKVDVHGPPPPTGITAGVGEGRVVLEWDNAASGTDIAGYNFYCSSVGSATAPANSPQGPGLLDGGVLLDSGIGADGAAGTTGIDGSAAGGTGGSAATDGGPSFNPECPTTALVPGEIPNEALRCGSVRGQFVAGGEASGLENGARYAVAVAGIDVVQNVGPLSEVVCGQPQLVDDFFERYRAAGGQGGGGFCSVGARPARGALLLVAGAGLALALRRRRWFGRGR